MTDKEIINNEKYHTCGRCKYETTPDDKYPCIACTHGTDHRTDLWELKQESDEIQPKQTDDNCLGFDFDKVKEILKKG